MEGSGLVLRDLVSPTLVEDAQMRQRHTERVQRPHGLTPMRPHGLTPIEDPLAHPTRSRIIGGRATRPRSTPATTC